MKLLILGVNGFIGTATAARAARQGAHVFGLSRSPLASGSFEGTYLRGDRRDPAAVSALVRDLGIDRVIDVLPMTLPDTKPLLDALDGHLDRYVMLSSCDVYQNYGLLQRLEEGSAAATLPEDAPLRTRRFPYRGATLRAADAPDRYLDDYDKIPIEEAVRTLTSPWTILRLPMVYGPGDRQHRFRWAIEPMARGDEVLEIPASWAGWTSTYGYLEDIADAIAECAIDARAAGQTFNLGEREPVEHRVWARRFADALGWQGTLQETDDPAHPFAAQLADLDLTASLIVDTSALRRVTGFEEPTPLADALAATISAETGAEGDA